MAAELNENDEQADQLRDYQFCPNRKQLIETPESKTLAPNDKNNVENKKRNNNNKCVVPAGILIVLCTICLGILAARESQGSSSNAQQTKEFSNHSHNECNDIDIKLEAKRQKMILYRLLEHPNVCYDMEIFIQMQGNDEIVEFEMPAHEDTQARSENTQATMELFTNKQDAKDSKKVSKLKPKRNGNGKHNGNGKNKSDTAKTSKSSNKSQRTNNLEAKKSSKAEPIIYLFALVFIYLLIKAASDINQHYKAKNKNDKRLRRCSLQSYAQAHKQDRRASKEYQRQQQKRLKELRSVSVDRYNQTLTQEQLQQKSDILRALRKQTSYDETLQQNLENTTIGQLPATRPQMSLELLVNHNAETPITTTTTARRCSMSFTQNNARRRLSCAPAVVHVPNLSRRTSVASGIGSTIGVSFNSLGIAIDAGEAGAENKRRVRMINRH